MKVQRGEDPPGSVDFRAKRPVRVLSAEDNEINQMIITAVMTKLGHEVTAVANGLAAVEANSKDDFDIILMDVRIPEMDGPEATRLIRNGSGHRAHVPVIAVTADAVVEHRAGYFEAGMNACVTKPIYQPALLRAINQVMGEEIHVPFVPTAAP